MTIRSPAFVRSIALGYVPPKLGISNSYDRSPVSSFHIDHPTVSACSLTKPATNLRLGKSKTPFRIDQSSFVGSDCRSALRDRYTPDYRDHSFGFRVAAVQSGK